MKLINFSLAFLLASNAYADGESTETKNLRVPNNKSSRQLQTSRQTDWVNAHNDKRKTYQKKYGGTYSSIQWSNSLKTKAATLAKSMAANKCEYTAPSNNDYGLNYYKSMMMSTVPTVSAVMSSWEGTLDSGYPANGAMTQVLWSSTKYVGCADAYSNDPSYKCYSTVCLYAKAGNCNMNNYPNWKDAVVEGPGCGKCPPNVSTC